MSTEVERLHERIVFLSLVSSYSHSRMFSESVLVLIFSFFLTCRAETKERVLSLNDLITW